MGNIILNLINFFAFTRPKYNPVPLNCEMSEREEICEYVTQIDDHSLHMYTLSTLAPEDKFDVGYVILYSGGNEESILDTRKRRLELLSFFKQIVGDSENVSIVTYNYPLIGYAPGESEFSFRIIERISDFFKQKPILDIVHKAIQAVFDKILFDYSNKDTKIIIWGRSIGSLPTGYLLHQNYKNNRTRILFSVIESGLASIIQARFPKVNLPFLLKDSNIDYATQNRNWGGIIFVHGSLDNVVSPENTLLLHKALDGSFSMIIKVEGAGHNIHLVNFESILKEKIKMYFILEKNKNELLLQDYTNLKQKQKQKSKVVPFGEV